MLEELLAANERYAHDFALGSLARGAARGVAVVTCMDARVDPLALLGLAPGDAMVMRNAGGRVTTDTLRSLLLASGSLGVVEVAVLHHSDCALAGRSDEQLRARLAEPQAEAARDHVLLGMTEPDVALAEDVDTIRHWPGLEALQVEGWRYDVATGRVARLVVAGNTEMAPDEAELPDGDHAGDEQRDALVLFAEASGLDASSREAEAVPLYRRAIDLGLPPELEYRALVQLGNSLRVTGDVAGAVEAHRRAAERWPERAANRCFFALALLSAGEAPAALSQAIEAVLWLAAGAPAKDVREYRQAIAAYAEAPEPTA
ncbi:MAG: carbonic anhydrase [Acidimicrobiaceae bacterium]|nr:carbonic anhydrase [Acidimicrobiaceae bacterium]